MPSNNIVIAFDLYGTLLSTESIAKELAHHFGEEKANSIAALWRRFQLEYTWRMNSMGNLNISNSGPISNLMQRYISLSQISQMHLSGML